MSLLRLVRYDETVKHLFKQHFHKPPLPPGPDIKAPPVTDDYQLIGTAFDYLLRFKIARVNSSMTENERDHRWVAENSLDLIRDPDKKAQAEENIEEARKMHDEFIETGKVTYELLKSVIRIARLDPIFRAGVGQEKIGEEVKQGNVEDLRKLLSVVPKEDFSAEEICLLNPTFGQASMLVRGADADLIIDDKIIDFKTTKKWRSRRRDFNQIAGYYTLHRLDNIERTEDEPDITSICIYFSRHGELHCYEVDELIGEDEFQEFAEKFEERCRERFEMLRQQLFEEDESEE